MKENIKYFLDKILSSSDNLVQVEYLFEELRKYIDDKKEEYKEVLSEYNQNELNKIIRQSYEIYVKRAKRIFYKEVLIGLLLVFVSTIILILLKIDIKILTIILFALMGLFFILRVSAFKRQLEEKLKKNMIKI